MTSSQLLQGTQREAYLAEESRWKWLSSSRYSQYNQYTLELSKVALDRDFNAVKAQELDLSILLDLSDLAMGFLGGVKTTRCTHP